MELYLDTANLDAIKKAFEYGVITGVTTNPSSMRADAGGLLISRIEEICELDIQNVSAQVVGTDAINMISEGRQLAGISQNVIVKLPCTREGIAACAELSTIEVDQAPTSGIASRIHIYPRCNLTLCCSVPQAILAALAGAWCISIFVARCQDIGIDPYGVIADVRKIYDRNGTETKILCGSLRSTHQVVDSFAAGADICTVSPQLLEKMFDHPLTESGLNKFINDWEGPR